MRVACEHGKVTRTAISSEITPRRTIEAREYYLIFTGGIREVSGSGNGNLNCRLKNAFDSVLGFGRDEEGETQVYMGACVCVSRRGSDIMIEETHGLF